MLPFKRSESLPTLPMHDFVLFQQFSHTSFVTENLARNCYGNWYDNDEKAITCWPLVQVILSMGYPLTGQTTKNSLPTTARSSPSGWTWGGPAKEEKIESFLGSWVTGFLPITEINLNLPIPQ